MKKLAIFVEGNTELLFIEKLIFEIAGFHRVSVQRQVLHGGAIQELYATGVGQTDAEFQVLITNCECDGKVKPAILERISSLHEKGYEKILGVRDVFPVSRDDLEKLRQGVQSGLDKLPVPSNIVLAVMEIETWFIAEWTHFSKVNPLLTPAAIKTKHGIDLQGVSAEVIDRPARLLAEIYEVVGQEYKKKAKDAYAVVSRLDYTHLYMNVRETHPSLDELMTHLDSFFVTA